jgi:uncharacterized protein (TIGR00297 family)
LALRLNLTVAGEKACAASFFTCDGFINPAVPQIQPQGRFAGWRHGISLNSSGHATLNYFSGNCFSEMLFLATTWLSLSNPWLWGGSVTGLLVLLALVVPKKILTPMGLAHAWFLGTVVWGMLGWTGWSVVIFYLAVGSGITFVGMEQKEAAGIAEARAGARGPGNLWGSALTGTVCALLLLVLPATMAPLLKLGFVASFATKLSDTTATEIGKAYGQRTFLITTLAPVPRGTEGAVSLEGTLAGIVGSLAIATFGWALGLISPVGIGICGVAALVATTLESVIGATVEEQFPFLTHHVVNIINTTIGAGVAIAIAVLVPSLV